MKDRQGNDRSECARSESEQQGRESVPAARRRYEAPRIERRIPVIANTLQGVSGGETQVIED